MIEKRHVWRTEASAQTEFESSDKEEDELNEGKKEDGTKSREDTEWGRMKDYRDEEKDLQDLSEIAEMKNESTDDEAAAALEDI